MAMLNYHRVNVGNGGMIHWLTMNNHGEMVRSRFSISSLRSLSNFLLKKHSISQLRSSYSVHVLPKENKGRLFPQEGLATGN